MQPPRLKSGRNPVTVTQATSSLHSSFQANCRENDELTAVNEEFKFHFLLLQALRQETTTAVPLYPQGLVPGPPRDTKIHGRSSPLHKTHPQTQLPAGFLARPPAPGSWRVHAQ